MITKKIALMLAITPLIFAGANQVNAQDSPMHQFSLSKADAEIIHGLARNFMSSKTDTPDSDLAVSPKAISISSSLSIVSFVGEDFSDHSSRIDRCYVGVYDSSKKEISIVKRKYNSGSSEDSTPCTKVDIYATGKDSTSKPWISFLSTYSNPQTGDSQDDDVIELYSLDLQKNTLCYDDKLTDEINSSVENPTSLKVEKFLSSKKILNSTECN